MRKAGPCRKKSLRHCTAMAGSGLLAFGLSGLLAAHPLQIHSSGAQGVLAHLELPQAAQYGAHCYQASLRSADGRLLLNLQVERSSSGLQLSTRQWLQEHQARLLVRNLCNDQESFDYLWQSPQAQLKPLPADYKQEINQTARDQARAEKLALTRARMEALRAPAPKAQEHPEPQLQLSVTKPQPPRGETDSAPAADTAPAPEQTPAAQAHLSLLQTQLQALESRISALHANSKQGWDSQQQWAFLLALLLCLALGAMGWLLLHMRRLQQSVSQAKTRVEMSRFMLPPEIEEDDDWQAQADAAEDFLVQELQEGPDDFGLQIDDLPALRDEAGRDGGWLKHAQSLKENLRREGVFDHIDEEAPASLKAVDTQMEVEEMHDALTEARFWASLQQEDVAIRILQDEVAQHQRAASWLTLLELYRKRGQQQAYMELRERCMQIFNCQVPQWEENPPPLRLADLPRVSQQLLAQIEKRQGLPYLQSLLLDERGGQRQGFAWGVYWELVEMFETMQHGRQAQFA
ncbi:hypothetical protein V8J88_04725 [Massilia sp. W12]|uniref:hypothetical protein n=1 Tax=Massilia sp. W12 TaxID=3126507 RepID=UPI0030D4A833